MTTIIASQVKKGDWIDYPTGVERVQRVTSGPRGYVHIRTNRCDHVVKVAARITRVPAPPTKGAE